MNGWSFAAVAVVCVTVLVVVLLWAVVRVAPRQASVESAEVEELSADEEFRVVQADLRRQIAEAVERAGREKRGGF